MLTLRFLVHRVLRGFNYDLRRYVTECGPNVRMLDLAVAAHVAAGAVPYFVQIGANDGVTGDPLHHLVLKYRLRGLLIEPMPDVFEQLAANYAGQPQVVFENSAVWSEDGERDFFRIRRTAGASPLVKGMAGLSHEALAGAARRLPRSESRIETMRVRCRTPTAIFNSHGVSQIDLLVVDVEGLDDRVLELVLGQGMTPAIIQYEHIHLAPDRQDRTACFLSDRGYRFARNRTDTLALLDAERLRGTATPVGNPP